MSLYVQRSQYRKNVFDNILLNCKLASCELQLARVLWLNVRISTSNPVNHRQIKSCWHSVRLNRTLATLSLLPPPAWMGWNVSAWPSHSDRHRGGDTSGEIPLNQSYPAPLSTAADQPVLVVDIEYLHSTVVSEQTWRNYVTVYGVDLIPVNSFDVLFIYFSTQR